jgi:hypothetical protein
MWHTYSLYHLSIGMHCIFVLIMDSPHLNSTGTCFHFLSRAGQVKAKEIETGASEKAASKEEIKH